jgi:hypothetical protein
MRRSIFYFSLACLCVLLALTNASAQIESGTINGTVADHGGAHRHQHY